MKSHPALALFVFALVCGGGDAATALAQVAPSTSESEPASRPAQDPAPRDASVRKNSASGPRGGAEPEINCNINGASNCQNLDFPRMPMSSLASCGSPHINLFRTCDQFRTDGAATHNLSQLCWWGGYGLNNCVTTPPPDSFVVTYFPRISTGASAGLPDITHPIATFTQSAGTLSVVRRATCNGTPEIYEFTASHAPTPLVANTCYFIEIRNLSNGMQNWFWGRSAFPTDGFGFQDVTSNGYSLAELIGTSSNWGDRAFCMNIGLDLFGTGGCLPPPSPPPSNDLCAAAEQFAINGPSVIGNTTLATDDFALPCGGARENRGRGVWYSVFGDGTTLTASTCNPGTSAFDTKLSVYCGDSCDLLNCVAGNDDAMPACGTNVRASSVSWCSEFGRQYFILIHGFNGTTGAYEFTVNSDSAACSPDFCEPCFIKTPPGAFEENEPCSLTNINGGCNTVVPPQGSMSAIACGETYHGLAWANNGTRDTDWYLLSLTQTQEVTVTFSSEFPGASFFISYASLDTCVGASFPGGVADPEPCGTGVNTAILAGPADYVIFVAVGSPGGGATFYGVPCGPNNAGNNYILSVECNTPCPGIIIPPNAVDESEGCGLELNGGCSTGGGSQAAVFENARCNVPVHGASFAEAGFRDTDWYRTRATAFGDVSVTVNPAFPATVIIFDLTFNPDGTCATTEALAITNIAGCSQDTLTAVGLVPGNPYYVFISPGNSGGALFDGLPCVQDYVITFHCDETCPCDWNHFDGVNSQDFFDFLIDFFGNDADLNMDGFTNSQDYFDFLTCFFELPTGC